MAKRAIIWREVACSNCGRTIGFDYKNVKTIATLKNKIKDWAYCDDEGNLCQNVMKSIRNEKNRKKTDLKWGREIYVFYIFI